mmetsp:Transcript_13119/g.15976  ORF Transcript_13119/g.15976 Transcript_13119/m.15976 type:complete len:85 (+) Transcript_13119:229-483(+)
MDVGVKNIGSGDGLNARTDATRRRIAVYNNCRSNSNNNIRKYFTTKRTWYDSPTFPIPQSKSNTRNVRPTFECIPARKDQHLIN